MFLAIGRGTVVRHSSTHLLAAATLALTFVAVARGRVSAAPSRSGHPWATKALPTTSLDPATKRYRATLKKYYDPLPLFFGAAVPPCVQSNPTRASLTECRKLDSAVAAQTSRLLAALQKVAVSVRLKRVHTRFIAAFQQFLRAIKKRIHYIDVHDLRKFAAADADMGTALTQTCLAVAAMNNALPSMYLGPPVLMAERLR